MSRYLSYLGSLCALLVLLGGGLLLIQPAASHPAPAQWAEALPAPGALPPPGPARPAQGTPTPTPTVGCGLAWRVVQSSSQYNTALQSVAVVAANDIWAVGGRGFDEIEHWNGTSWSSVPFPNPNSAAFYGVAAVAANDVWAVGVYYNGNTAQTLTEHWDGSAWSIVPSPNPGATYNDLYGVAAVASNDVWAVGYSYNGSIYQTLTEHWNGSAWSIVPSPNPGSGNNQLFSVAAVASNDVWAVGTLIAHWDGSTWSVVPSPGGGLYGVAALAANNVWAVGVNGSSSLTEHWDGSAWSIVPSPNPGTYNYLYAVAAIGSNDVWAVGSYYPGSVEQPLAEHWDGAAWNVVASPYLSADSYLYGVAAVASNDVWAVGLYGYHYPNGALIERYNDLCAGSVTPTPLRTTTATATRTNTPIPTSTPTAPPTQTPGGPSPTPGPASSTPTATATATLCALAFTDVPPSDPFYPYIRCLACRAIISGYSTSPPCAPGGSPCYNGGAPVTRGQVAKIVSNAAGFQEAIPSTRQTFADVPPSQPFWLYIERLAAPGRGYISGYATSPPCPPGQTPCFLPFNAVTRGQMAKIDANAAGLQEPVPSTQQTFEDVPSSNAFWLYVERLAPLNVISGYQCGAPPAGPCLPPGNRPYFLWANALTRGQAAKIVATTFYPACATPLRQR